MKVRLDFCDFWPGFVKTDNWFYNALKTRFDIELTDCPDFVIYSDPNKHIHRLHNCVRIFVGVEWWLPDWGECDYALTSNYVDDPRHLRLPAYVLCGGGIEPLLKDAEAPEKILAEKTGFCSFVVRKSHPHKRIEIFQRLSRYKSVDSGGPFMNNIGGAIPLGQQAKIEFLRKYKFHLALENKSREGWTTEKICDAMAARSLPIYWGNPRIGVDFNPKSFINYFDFPSEDAFIERIVHLDQDDAKYLEYLRQPYFHNNRPNEFFNMDRLLDFFDHIFSTPITPVARRSCFFEVNRWLLARKNRHAEF